MSRRHVETLFLVGALLGCAPGGPETSDPAEPAPGSSSVSVTLAWDAPTADASGNPLNDLEHYVLYYDTRSPVTPATATRVQLGAETTHRLEGLEPVVYFVAVSAVDESGNESALSEELRLDLRGPER